MGDRTNCSLYCYRDDPLTDEEATTLTAAIVQAKTALWIHEDQIARSAQS